MLKFPWEMSFLFLCFLPSFFFGLSQVNLYIVWLFFTFNENKFLHLFKDLLLFAICKEAFPGKYYGEKQLYIYSRFRRRRSQKYSSDKALFSASKLIYNAKGLKSSETCEGFFTLMKFFCLSNFEWIFGNLDLSSFTTKKFFFLILFTHIHHIKPIQYALLNTFPLLVLMSSNLFDRCGDWFVGKCNKKRETRKKGACLSVSDKTGNFLSIFVNGQEVFYSRWFLWESMVICEQQNVCLNFTRLHSLLNSKKVEKRDESFLEWFLSWIQSIYEKFSDWVELA